MKIVPDTSVIIDGRVTSKVEEGELQGAEIIIPEAVVSELEAQANKGQETGMSGLEEVQSLREFHEQDKITLIIKGERPTFDQVQLASGGEIDAMVRELASAEEAVLMTSDIVQAEIGRAKGLEVEYLKPESEYIGHVKWIREYFEDDVMSVHLRVKTKPKVKRGTPGNLRMEVADDRVLDETELRHVSHEVIERAKRSPEGFIELDKSGATVVQLEDMRIVISRPPFSDGFEITAVRPVAKVSLDDYRLSEELKERISEKQRGVLLSGSPGAGKSTLAQAVAEYLLKKDFVVKTMEKPRDLQVSDEITQYTDLDGKLENTADVLLLVRPDYTVFDEVRKTPDFRVFADMRLAGVGMVGVTHANRAIDALQRLIGRVELGMVPQVVDTIIYVEAAEIAKVYDITFTVKVPAGMTEEDLARPVIQVKDFETGEAEYEVYTYGEQVVVMPVKGASAEGGEKSLWRLAASQIEYEISQYVSGTVECEMTSDDRATVYIPDHQIPALLGRDGERIDLIEDDLGIHIDVRPLKDRKEVSKEYSKKSVMVYEESDKMILDIGNRYSKEGVDIYADGEYLTTATVGGDGTINIRKNTQAGQKIYDAMKKNKDIEIG